MTLAPSYVMSNTANYLSDYEYGRPPAAKTSSFLVPGLTRDIHVKIATEADEFTGAFELLTANYRARGYEPEGGKPYRFTPHHVLPQTVTLVAKHGDRVVATLSLVPDTDLLGLPLESIYRDEVETLRGQGRRLAEVICLADTDLTVREFIKVFKSLIKLEMQYHRSCGGDTWVIVVNPRHSGFYQRVLGFESMGPQRTYPSVQNHPAEAYILDLNLMMTNAPEMYHEIFGEDLSDDVLHAHAWSAERVRHFGGQSSQIEGEKLEDLLDAIDHSEGSPRWV